MISKYCYFVNLTVIGMPRCFLWVVRHSVRLSPSIKIQKMYEITQNKTHNTYKTIKTHHRHDISFKCQHII